MAFSNIPKFRSQREEVTSLTLIINKAMLRRLTRLVKTGFYGRDEASAARRLLERSLEAAAIAAYAPGRPPAKKGYRP
jgi:hypothetical protein